MYMWCKVTCTLFIMYFTLCFKFVKFVYAIQLLVANKVIIIYNFFQIIIISSRIFSHFYGGLCFGLLGLKAAEYCASSNDNPFSMKSCLTLSIHLRFGLPFLLLPNHHHSFALISFFPTCYLQASTLLTYFPALSWTYLPRSKTKFRRTNERWLLMTREHWRHLANRASVRFPILLYLFVLMALQIKWTSFWFVILLLPLHLIHTFMWGRCTMTCIYTPPCSTIVYFFLRQSLLFDIIPHSVQPSSLRPSSVPSPLYFHFHRPPSYVVLLSSHHIAHTTSISFPGLSSRFPPLLLSSSWFNFLSCPDS